MIKEMNLHYSFTTPASVHDEEALTALELAGRQGKKINEIIVDQNNLRTTTENKLREQDAEIENEFAEQHATLARFENETIPSTVDSDINKYINNGAFDNAIDTYAGELEARVDNLLGSVTEGSSTLDAEVIDLRVGADGNTYNTAGEAVRKSANKIFESDVVKATHNRQIEQTRVSGNYNGVDTYKQLTSNPFNLEAGDYSLYVSETNCIGLVISDVETGKRIIQYSNTPIGRHDFTIDETYANKELLISFNCSLAEPNTAGEYYANFYLYDYCEDGLLPDYLISKSGVPLLETDLINYNHPNFYPYNDLSLIYYGTSLWTYTRSGLFTLPAGEYMLIIPDTNFIGIYIMSDDSDDVRLVSTTSPEGVHYFTVNDEQAAQKWFIQCNASLGVANTAGEYFCAKPYIFANDGTPLLPDYITGVERQVKNGYLIATADSMASGQVLHIDDTVNVKKNKSLQFGCDFATFGGVRIGHGKSSYSGNYIEITENTLDIYSFTTSAKLVKSVAHGLNITDFISVNINVGVGICDISITTKSGMFSVNEITWNGCNGLIFAEPINSTLDNVKLVWTSKDINCPTWVFGDSYIGLTSSNRYPKYILDMGYENWLACGYPGGVSSAELASLKSLLTLGKPKTIIWCLGMNNGDQAAINSQWKTCVENVKTLCSANNIELILATIPSTPTVDNSFKNTYVKESGYRFIDFEKAVKKDGAWYDGMLDSDNVHPTENGARALAMQMLLDAPEIMQ